MASAAAWTAVPKKSVTSEARLQKTPYMLVVGQKEEEEGVVSVRSRFKGDEGAQSLDAFIDDICKEIRTKEIRKVEVTPESK